MVDTISAFMHGLESPIILWLLSKSPAMHGYDLFKEVKKLTGQKLRPSMLYPLLYRLEAEGLIMGEWAEKGRREIKCYCLTEKGETHLVKMTNLFKMPIGEVIIDLLNK